LPTSIGARHRRRRAAATAARPSISLMRGHRLAVVRIDEDLAGVVLGDVRLRAGGRDGRIVLPRADEEADLFGIDLDGLDALARIAEVGAGARQRGEHRAENLDARIAAWKIAPLAI